MKGRSYYFKFPGGENEALGSERIPRVVRELEPSAKPPSGSQGVLSLIQLRTELVGLKEFRAFAEPCGECRDGQNSVCPLGIPNL